MPYPSYPQYPIYPTTYPPVLSSSLNPTLQPQFSRPYIAGRIVNNSDEIQPNEVAMDGSVSFFPTKDYKAIYAKQWNKDGTISTIEYQPVANQKQENSSLDPALTGYIDDKFASLEKLIRQQRKPYQKKEAADHANGSSDVRA